MWPSKIVEAIVAGGYAKHGEHAANLLQLLYDNSLIDPYQEISIIVATVDHYRKLSDQGLSRNAIIDALFREATHRAVADPDAIEEIAY